MCMGFVASAAFLRVLYNQSSRETIAGTFYASCNDRFFLFVFLGLLIGLLLAIALTLKWLLLGPLHEAEVRVRIDSF